MAYYNRQKPAKLEMESKLPIITIWPHTHPYEKLERKEEIVAIIDPGTRNYCIRVERRTIYGDMTPLLYAKWDLNPKEEIEGLNMVYPNLTRKLNGYKELLITTDRVLIEKQLPINYQSTLIMQHTQSYFEILLTDRPNLPTIHLIDPKLKSRILAGKRRMTKPELKAWSPGEAIKWLQLQCDSWSVDILNSVKKKDDYADVVVMREAYYQFTNSPLKTPDTPKIEFVVVNK